jgi:phage terminase Nu1 subunit (DNA packaging protein)
VSATPGVDVATVARIFGVNVSSVHRLAKEPGFPPKLAPGVFDLQKATIWYIRYLQSVVRRRGPSGGPETALVATERLRVLKGQATKIELGNAVQRGEYLPAASVAAVWSRRLTICRARMLAMPHKLAPLLADKQPSYIAERMKHEVYAVLTELAADDDGGADPSVGANALTDNDAPAADDSP